MEDKASLLEPLFEKALSYSKTSSELLQLKALAKASDLISQMVSRLVLTVFLMLFIIIMTIGISLWLGDLLGKSYYGFFIFGAIYFIIGVLIIIIHPQIKKRVNDLIISQALN